jgi:GntR family transcriptional regulator/MocR family aminotransferase
MLTLASDGIESEKLQKTKAGLLHITPYRSYPSGVSATAAKKREYVKWAAKRNGILVEDDFESEFSPSRKNEETLMAIDGGERVIYVNTFSMTISPSVRVAYMVVPERLLGRFSENTGFYSCTVPTLDQYVIAELIGNGDFERHINRVRRLERQEKRSYAQKGGN